MMKSIMCLSKIMKVFWQIFIEVKFSFKIDQYEDKSIDGNVEIDND